MTLLSSHKSQFYHTNINFLGWLICLLFSETNSVRPGILKKSAHQSRQNAVLRHKRQLDTILEQKFAAITSDCANKTAFNSVCNQFLNPPGKYLCFIYASTLNS